MNVIRTGTGYMPDGTPVYIEDWTVDFKGTDVNPYIVAAFPVSTFTMPGKWSPNAGEKFRYAMRTISCTAIRSSKTTQIIWIALNMFAVCRRYSNE